MVVFLILGKRLTVITTSISASVSLGICQLHLARERWHTCLKWQERAVFN